MLSFSSCIELSWVFDQILCLSSWHILFSLTSTCYFFISASKHFSFIILFSFLNCFSCCKTEGICFYCAELSCAVCVLMALSSEVVECHFWSSVLWICHVLRIVCECSHCLLICMRGRQRDSEAVSTCWHNSAEWQWGDLQNTASVSFIMHSSSVFWTAVSTVWTHFS